MTLHDKFDRVVVISLPARKDRRARLEKNFLATGIADPEKVVWRNAVDKKQFPASAWWSAGGGAWGCMLSHVAEVLRAAQDGVESLFLIEDDAVWSETSVPLLEGLAKDWPDQWGQIYLGGQTRGNVALRKGSAWLDLKSINRTHAYGIHRSIFGKFVAHVLYAPDYLEYRRNNPKSALHIDHQLERAHARRDWPVFAPRVWLAGQRGGKSDISGRDNRDLWWQPPHGFVPPLVLLPPGMKSKDPAFRKFGWAGKNLIRDTCEDIGANEAAQTKGKKKPFLDAIVPEAIWHRRLPCVQHHGWTKSTVANAHKGDIVAVKSPAQLRKLYVQTMLSLDQHLCALP